MSMPESVNAGEGITPVKRDIKNLRIVRRTIVSAYIQSTDDFLLMGRQDPTKGGTFPNAWRIPGGGVKLDGDNNPLEDLDEAMVREGNEEVIGLNLTLSMVKLLDTRRTVEAKKTLPSGEAVWQVMDLRHFCVSLDKPADQFTFAPGSDLVELNWFTREERETIELIAGGRELMRESGYLNPLSDRADKAQ